MKQTFIESRHTVVSISDREAEQIADFFITKFNTILQELHDMQVDEEEKHSEGCMYNEYPESKYCDCQMRIYATARNQARAQFRADITSKFIK